MNRLKIFLTVLLVATLIFSCSKDDTVLTSKLTTEHFTMHDGHYHVELSGTQEPYSGIEEYTPFIKLIDHPIYPSIEPILPDKFSPDNILELEQGYVWEYEEGGKAVYTIDYKYLEGSMQKVLVSTDTDNNVKTINIMEIFIGSTNNSLNLHNIDIDSLVIYPVDSERTTKGDRNNRSSLDDCLKVVFGDNSSGNGTIDPGSPGTSPSGTTGGTTIEGGDGTIYSGDEYLFFIICGCRPAHSGGNANTDCDCRKSDRLLMIKKPDTIKEGDNGASNRNNPEYWDCIEQLIGAQLLNDYDLGIMTLKHCHGVYDTNDVDPQAGNDGSNQFIGPEFCDDWKDYQDQCLGGSTSTSGVYQPWAEILIDYPDLFYSTIESLPVCKSTDEMEDFICVESSFEALLSDYGINLSEAEKDFIKEGLSCTNNPDISESIKEKLDEYFDGDGLTTCKSSFNNYTSTGAGASIGMKCNKLMDVIYKLDLPNLDADFIFKCYDTQDLCITTGQYELDEGGNIKTDHNDNPIQIGMNTRKELTAKAYDLARKAVNDANVDKYTDGLPLLTQVEVDNLFRTTLVSELKKLMTGVYVSTGLCEGEIGVGRPKYDVGFCIPSECKC